MAMSAGWRRRSPGGHSSHLSALQEPLEVFPSFLWPQTTAKSTQEPDGAQEGNAEDQRREERGGRKGGTGGYARF